MLRTSGLLVLFSLQLGLAQPACLTTLPPTPRFVPPAPYLEEVGNGSFWYGTEALWTRLSEGGTWRANPQGDLVTKLIFRRRGFDWHKEHEPNLITTARRIDGVAPVVTVSHASAVFVTGDPPAAIMTRLHLPTTGCWEISAHYGGSALTFTVLVQR